MKKIISTLLIIWVLVSSLFIVNAFAASDRDYVFGDTSRDMIEKWFGDDVELFSMDEGSDTSRVKGYVQAYFDIRLQSVYNFDEIEDAEFLSDEVAENENERRRGFEKAEGHSDIIAKSAANNIRFRSVKKQGNKFIVDAYEWVFYDYANEGSGQKVLDLAGFGTEHIIVVEKTADGFVIISDEYNEADMNGMDTRSEDVKRAEREASEAEVFEYDKEAFDDVELMGFYSGYDPDEAIEYSDEYCLDYNDDWPNYNSVGGDCANFVSQCLYAGGMPMREGPVYSQDCWFHYSSTNRSSSWTGAKNQHYYMANYRGIERTARDETIYYGSPVYYYYNGGSSCHAVICVGTNSSGVPIINSHNADRYHKVWTYMSNMDWAKTVQITEENLNEPYVPTTDVDIEEDYIELVVGKTYTLDADVYPSDATNKTLTWKSSNTSVATVSSSGKVTAKGAGTAKITATTKEGHYDRCTVEVEEPIRVTGVYLDKTSVTMEEGDVEYLEATVRPSNAANQNITWKSSNTSVATVSASGKVTAKSPGRTTITVTTEDGKYTATCAVEVAYYPVTRIYLNKTSLNIDEGDTETITATVYPDNATNPSVTWTSSNTAVATVSQTGKITAKKGGTATITVTADDNSSVYARCYVTVVYDAVTGVTLDKTILEMSEGDTYTLKETISPYNATYKDVTWTTSNKAVATVTSTGKVTAKGEGSARITVTTDDGGYMAYCYVTVKHYPVTGITLDKSYVNIITKNKYTLTPTIAPYNASDKGVIWTTSDKSIATVSSSGVVTAKNNGTAIITATTKDGGFTASCTVKVSAFAWNYSYGVLTIEGKGDMDDYISESGQPWATYRNSATQIVVKKGITHIGANAFKNFIYVRSVELPSTVKSIGEAAFYGDKVLYEIDVDDALEYIGADAFANTGISADTSNWYGGGLYLGDNLLATKSNASAYFTVKDGTETIADKAFAGVGGKMVSVTLADEVETICPRAFEGCTVLRSVAIGPKMGEFDVSAFADCVNLQEFEVDEKNRKYYSDDGVLYTKNKKTLVCYPVGKPDSEYTVLDAVTAIGDYAFAGCAVEEITLPSKLKSVGYGAFSGCDSLTDVHYMKYEKDWNKIKIGENNSCLTIADVHYLIPVTSVSLNRTEADGEVGGVMKLTATVYPSNATLKDVTWKSSSTKIAEVDENGFIRFLKKGKVTITATSVDGKKKATCKIEVVDNTIHVEKVTLEEEGTIIIYLGEEYEFSAVLEPSNTDYPELIWTSSSKKVCEVDEDGRVTALKAGTATITVKSVDGGKKDTCKVKVIDPNIYAKKITLDKKKATMYVGDAIIIEATVTPDDVTFEGVEWTSSKESVAIVDKNGAVYAVGKGSATITATTADGKKKATCKITVKE